MIDWATTAITFPGQGSQQVGMGADLAAEFSQARGVFERADQVYGHAFSKLIFDGPADELDKTENTQPALYVVGMAVLRALEEKLGALQPIAAAGHSLGEFTALTAAGALAYEDGLRLVRERGRLMAEAGERSPGGMAALLGAELDSVRSICERAGQESGQPVVIANDNCPGQIVISGDNTAVDRALELAKTQGIKRAVRLAVSVATHSPLMAHASAAFHAALDATPLADPHYPVIGNTTAAPLRTADDIRAELNAQLINTVRWRESVEAMLNLGVRTFFELGPKEVLTGLLKRIDRDATGTPINTTTGLASLS